MDDDVVLIVFSGEVWRGSVAKGMRIGNSGYVFARRNTHSEGAFRRPVPVMADRGYVGLRPCWEDGWSRITRQRCVC